ncbi:MAG: outer membrane lipoprotein carrier protein LolA [Desulfobacteraceae bacterium]|nr:outer membrane lipoprotein carrier protein LolA [Desulfobacteraceae bacterium]
MILDKIENNFTTVRTLKTKLEQEKNIPVFSETIISKGFCIFQRPDRLRLEFVEPFQSVLIVDGKKVTKYEFFDGQWQKLSPGSADILLKITGNITSWLQGRFRDPDLYKISAVRNENLTVKLIPKAAEFKQFIRSFELGLNKSLDSLEYIVITENNEAEAFTRIRFFNDVKNDVIPETVFRDSDTVPSKIPTW